MIISSDAQYLLIVGHEYHSGSQSLHMFVGTMQQWIIIVHDDGPESLIVVHDG